MPAGGMTRLGIALGVVVLLLGLMALGALRSCSSARVESRVATQQRDAASASGHDAVETLGNAVAREQDVRVRVEVGSNAIRNAPAGDSNDAALRAACGMRSYRGSEQCVELLGPVAE